MWDTLRPTMQGLGLDPVRVESAYFPDVNYADGLLELKRLDHWPVRMNTPVMIQTLQERAGQVAALARRWCSGGAAFMLLRVEQELLLFDGWTTRAVRDGEPRAWLYEHACWIHHGKTETGSLSRLKLWLQRDVESMDPRDRARYCRLSSRTPLASIARELCCSEAALIAAELGTDSVLLDDLLGYWES